MVPGYDHPLVWEGHASMVHEIKRQLPEGITPDAIFCSLGGGGLAGGLIEGCKAVGWDDSEYVSYSVANAILCYIILQFLS